MALAAGTRLRQYEIIRGLFDGAHNLGIESGRSYDVNPANGRFLLVKPVDDGSSARTVRMVLNWALALPR